MVKRILVGLSGTPYSLAACQTAIELATRHEAALTGVTVIDPKQVDWVGPVPLGGGAAAKELRDHRQAVTKERVDRAIEHFCSACNAARLSYHVDREQGKPFALMIARARYHDLLILGVRGLFDYGYVAEPAELLVRLVHAGAEPILAVSEQFRPIRRVLVGYSGSTESAKALRWFMQMRLWSLDALRIVNFEQTEEIAHQLLDDAAAYCRASGIEPETSRLPGPAEAELLPYAAKWEADLVVIGNVKHSVFVGRLLGSTALSVIRDTQRPLFLA